MINLKCAYCNAEMNWMGNRDYFDIDDKIIGIVSDYECMCGCEAEFKLKEEELQNG